MEFKSKSKKNFHHYKYKKCHFFTGGQDTFRKNFQIVSENNKKIQDENPKINSEKLFLLYYIIGEIFPKKNT